MDFLILFHGTDGRSLRPEPEAYQAHLQRLQDWIKALDTEGGKLIMAEPLRPQVFRIGPKGVVTDGPFIEGKEMVGGYLRFSMPSQQAAMDWAAHCPIFEFPGAAVELRAIEPLDL